MVTAVSAGHDTVSSVTLCAFRTFHTYVAGGQLDAQSFQFQSQPLFAQ
jgi:hypothetical protein